DDVAVAGPQHVDRVVADAGVDQRVPDPREVVVVAAEGAQDVEGVAAGAAVDGHAAHAEGVEGDRRRGQAGEGPDIVDDVQGRDLADLVVRVVHVDLADAVAVEVDDIDRRQDALHAEPRLAEVDRGDVELAVDRDRLDRGLDVDRIEVAHAGP